MGGKTFTTYQIDVLKQELPKMTPRTKICKILGTSHKTLLTYIKELNLPDPVKKKENRIVTVQILVRKKYATTAIRDFQEQANKKYKL